MYGKKLENKMLYLYQSFYCYAGNGWYRYESRFALPVYGDSGEVDRYNVFHVYMIIRHDQNGKKYLYDVINIKKETSTPLSCQ